MKSKRDRPSRMETREPQKRLVRTHSDREGGPANKPTKDSIRGQVERFIDAIFGIRCGTVILAQGIGGRFTPSGSYRFNGALRHCPFAWPGDREAIVIWILKHRHLDDVYVIPNRRNAPNAKAEHGKHGRYVWADLDVVNQNTLKLLTPLLSRGSLVVESGGGRGGLHVYLRLDGWYPRSVFQVLNQQLANYLSGDSKFRDNSLLRVPGTLNHKGRAEGGVSRPVILRNESYEVSPWAPEALTAVLGPLPHKSGAKGHQRSQNPVAGWPKIRHQSIALVPIEEVTEKLPEDVIRCLDFSWTRHEHGDQSRSGQLHALVARTMSHGYRDGQIMWVADQSQPARDKWPNWKSRHAEIQRCISKLRPEHLHAGITCEEAGCTNGHFRCGEVLDTIYNVFSEHYRPGRSLPTDGKIMDALLRIALKIDDLGLNISVRELAVLAGISRGTAQAGLRRLVNAEYLHKVETQTGDYKNPGGRHILNRANRYVLSCPGAEVMTSIHKNAEGGVNSNPNVFEMLDPTHDVWHFNGLQRARPTLRALAIGYSNPYDIADYRNITPNTAREHLRALAKAGLVEQRLDTGEWTVHPRQLDEVAEVVGTLGRGAKRRVRYQAESQRNIEQLAFRKSERERLRWEMENRDFEERIAAGWFWAGPHHCVLVPPSSLRNRRRPQ